MRVCLCVVVGVVAWSQSLLLEAQENGPEQTRKPGWHTRFIQIKPGNNADDIQIDNTTEAHILATEVSGVGNTGVLSNGSTYNVTAVIDGLNNEIEFAGSDVSPGNFSVNNPFPGGHGGSNFVVTANALLSFPEGTYTINSGSDDGTRITMPGATFHSIIMNLIDGSSF